MDDDIFGHLPEAQPAPDIFSHLPDASSKSGPAPAAPEQPSVIRDVKQKPEISATPQIPTSTAPLTWGNVFSGNQGARDAFNARDPRLALAAKLKGVTPEKLGRENEAAAGEMLHGIPFAGAFTPQTSDMATYEREHPWGTAGWRAVGGMQALAPAIMAAPALFGADAAVPLGMRTLASAGSSGTLAGSDSLVRDIAKGTGAGETLKNAAVSGGVGLAAGAALPPVFAGIGAAASPVVKYLMTRFNPLTTASGALTQDGVAAARAAGLDPEKLTPGQIKQFANAADPQKAAEAFGSKNEWGIENTLGQRTKDPQQLHAEEQMRRGLMRQPAKDIMTGFDQGQRDAVANAAGVKIPGQIAPGVDPTLASRQSMGSTVKSALQGARGAAKLRENEAWTNIGPIHASDEAKRVLPSYVQNSANTAGIDIDPQLTPAADKMLNTMQDFISGEPLRNPYSILGEKPPVSPHLDELRRKLLSISNSAANPTDGKAANALYNGFNEWVGDIAGAPNGLASGDPADVAKLVAARDITKQVRALYTPTARGSKTLSPSGKILDNALSGESTPESVINNIIGTGPTDTINNAQVEALRRVKAILSEPTGSVTQGPPANKNAWDSIKLAYWNNLTANRAGDIATPGTISTRLQTAFKKQKSVLDVLYSPEEQAMMKSYKQALDTITYKPPNASGSSYGIQQPPEDSIKSMLLRRAARAIGAPVDFTVGAVRTLLNPEAQKANEGAQAVMRAIGQSVAQREPYPLIQQSSPVVRQAIQPYADAMTSPEKSLEPYQKEAERNQPPAPQPERLNADFGSIPVEQPAGQQATPALPEGHNHDSILEAAREKIARNPGSERVRAAVEAKLRGYGIDPAALTVH